MKLTVIYGFPHGVVEWSTPSSIYEEFRSRNWEIELVNIKDTYGNITDRYLQEFIRSDSSPDIVLFMDWGQFDSPYLDKKHKPNAFWIQESGDDPQRFFINHTLSHKFHYTISNDYQSYLKYKKLGRNVDWVIPFADSRIYKPYDVPLEYVAVSSRGRGHSDFLDTLEDISEGQIVNRRGFLGEDHGKFLRSGLMVVQNSRHQEITRRVLEGACCGRLVLTDKLPEHTKIEELLVDRQDVVYYNGIADCIEKLNYYAENHEERERIALNGYSKVMNNFTQVQVVDKLLKTTEAFFRIRSY
jgi:glycosyltransferase involved in cell wall biosynthesis